MFVNRFYRMAFLVEECSSTLYRTFADVRSSLFRIAFPDSRQDHR